jgi:O-antigen/teichoic acid export membrane protein
MNSGTGESSGNLVSSTALLTTGQYAAAAVGFLTTLLAARWLGPEAFGLAAVIMAYPAAVSSFASVKTSTVIQRYVSGFRATHRHPELLAACKLGFVTDFAVSVLATALVIGLASLPGDLPGTAGNGELVAVFALSLPLGSFVGTSIVVLFAFERIGLVAALQVLQKVLLLLAVVTALLIEPATSALVLAIAAGQALGGLVYLAVASLLLGRDIGDEWWRASWVSLRGFGRELRSLLGWNFLGVTLTGALTHVPVLLLGATRSHVEAGYFRLGSTIAITADAVEAAMSRVAYSTLAAAHAEGDVQRASRLIVAWSRRESLLGLLAVVAGMALLPALIFIGLGRQYMGMIAGTEMLLVGTAASTAFFFVMPYLYSTGRIKKWVVPFGIYALVVLAASSLLAEQGGFFAVASLVGIGLGLLNITLGVPILRQTRRMTVSEDVEARALTPSISIGRKR